jgi:hypothetical protein
MSRHLTVGGFALLASALTIPTASASSSTEIQDQDDWLAWHGCWQPDGATNGERLCIVPDGAGVRMITVQGDAIVAESRVIADDRERAVRNDDCSGSEIAYWSADGRRVFLSSELTCGEGVSRKASGVFAFTSAHEWVSVQAVTIDDQTATRTVRYSAAESTGLPASITNAFGGSRSARNAARLIALQAIDEDDVSEAVNSIDPVAVQAWLAETNQPYQLDADVQNASGQITYTSALDQVGRMSNPVVYKTREVVHVVERPVVHRTYVTHVVRSCWDPFYSGWAFGYGRAVTVGVSYGYPCGGYYYSRYSPWGYDLYGWRYVRAPLLIVRHYPVIIRRGSGHYYHRTSVRRDHDRWNGGRVTRDGYRRGGTRTTTRSGYSTDRERATIDRERATTIDRERTTVERTDRDRAVRQTRSVRETRPVDQTRTREARPIDQTRTREARPIDQTRTREARPVDQTRTREARPSDRGGAVRETRSGRVTERSQPRASSGSERSGGGRSQARHR